MPTYLHPGVYVEEIPSGARPIESAGTSTAAIIGFATKGPMEEPELIFNWAQYREQFGGIQNRHGATPAVDYMGHTAQAFFNNGGGKAYIVRLAPGALAGNTLLAVPAASLAGATIGESFNVIDIEAVNPGEWTNGIIVSLTEADNTATPILYDLSVLRKIGPDKFDTLESFEGITLDATDDNFITNVVEGSSGYIKIKSGTPVAGTATAIKTEDVERFSVGSLTSDNLSALTITDVNGQNLAISVDGSTSISVALTATATTTLGDIATQIQQQVTASTEPEAVGFTCAAVGDTLVLSSGSSSLTSAVTLGTAAAPSAATNLELTVAAGGITQTGQQAAIAAFRTVTFATLRNGTNGSIPISPENFDITFQKMRKIRDANIILIPDHQFSGGSKAIIDKAKAHAEFMETGMVIIDPPVGSELESASDVSGLGLPASPYTALYYPWVEVVNPYYHPELRAHLKPTYFVPPSGFAAGMWAKIDGRRGVWKAPAGLGTGLTGAARTEFKVGNDEQDQLNPLGINCYRTILSEPVIWGSRTLATKANPEKRYVPVQRTTLMLKESIFQGIQWAVFEPNDHNLWASLRLNIETFMDGLHRAGAFQGEKASDAYFVRCGLGQTMTQGDIDAGRVIVEVGFAPLKPAEFVIVRIQQKTAQL